MSVEACVPARDADSDGNRQSETEADRECVILTILNNSSSTQSWYHLIINSSIWMLGRRVRVITFESA